MNPPRHAFTILELMVSIAVIAVLLGILLPALGGAKMSVIELAAMAHQREVGALVRQHGFDRQDTFPFFGIPGTDRGRLCFAEDDPLRAGVSYPPCIDTDYWDQWQWWQSHMRFLGYDTAFVGRPPELERQNDGLPVVLGTIDWMTWTAYAPPNFFREDSPQPVSDHNVQRWASVAFPSDKVILRRYNYVREPGSTQSGETLSWFADGHVEPLNTRDMGPAVAVRLHLFGGGLPGLTTRDGLLGRDR